MNIFQAVWNKIMWIEQLMDYGIVVSCVIHGGTVGA